MCLWTQTVKSHVSKVSETPHIHTYLEANLSRGLSLMEIGGRKRAVTLQCTATPKQCPPREWSPCVCVCVCLMEGKQNRHTLHSTHTSLMWSAWGPWLDAWINEFMGRRVLCFICCFIVEDESAGGSLCEWRAALSATRDSVLISKQTPKHVLDLRVKSKMLTKSRLENWSRKLPHQSWVQQVGVSINTLVGFIARRQKKTYPRAHRSGRDPLHGVPAVAVLERAWGGPSW